jgi:hypothetical protein
MDRQQQLPLVREPIQRHRGERRLVSAQAAWQYTDDFGKRRIYPCRERWRSGSRWARRAISATHRVHHLAGNLYECPWKAFRLGHFKGMDDEGAALALAAWARRDQIHIMFEVRRVREHDVVYVLMRDKRN